MRAYRIERFGSVDGIVAADEPEPRPGPGQVVVQGTYPVAGRGGVVPVSDGAGTVQAVGDGVRTAEAGDHVTAAYFPRWRDGRFRLEFAQEQFGCTRDGMLADSVLADESAGDRRHVRPERGA